MESSEICELLLSAKMNLSPWKPVPLHADTDDLEEVVQHIRRRFPDAKIICVGFSLGSNLLLRYLGTAGDASMVYAAISVANGFDMVQGRALVVMEPHDCKEGAEGGI